MATAERGRAARVREICQKLKPIIGEQAERCWFAYISENDEGKEQIESYLELVAAQHLLFPHLSALENVAFGPRSRGMRRAHARERAQQELDALLQRAGQ